MDIATVALTVLNNLPAFIAAGQDVTDLIQNAISVIEAAQKNGTDPSADDWAKLDAKLSDLRSKL